MYSAAIIQEYLPQYRVQLFKLIIELGAQRGIDVKIYAGKPQGEQRKRGDDLGTEFGIPIRQVELRFLGRRLSLRQLPRSARTADIVILEQARRNLDSYIWLSKFRRPGKVTALWGHGRDFTLEKNPAEQRLLDSMTRRADWFFAYTESGAAHVVDSGYPPEKITVLKNTVDTNELHSHLDSWTLADIREFENKYKIGSKSALYMGGLDQSKKISFLIESCTEIVKQVPGFHLIICGDGADRGLVEEAAAEHSWLTYLGPQFGRDKALAMRTAKIILNPGRVGLLAVESLSAGLPIVTMNWDFHAPEFDYLENGNTCVVSSANLKSYVQTTIELLNDEARLRELSLACVAESAAYTIESMAHRYVEGIHNALKGHGVLNGW